MNKTEDEVVRLTAECLTRYWKRDSTFIFSHCAPKIVWISARQDEYLLTLDEVKENLETNCAAIPSCHLQHAEFQVAASCSELFVITGKYLVTTDPEEKFFLSAQQRCTFVWENTGNGLQISHIHISNPIGELKIAEDEAFPDTMGKMASHYMKEEILRLTSDRKLSVCDVNGSLIFLQMSDVMFISALGKETVVRTLTDCIFAKNSIKELAQQTQDCFVMTHRSYLVNPQYITAIRRYAITMQDGTELPVPRKNMMRFADRFFRYNFNVELYRKIILGPYIFIKTHL